ncbi:MAG TPA: PAS domain S-box protein [Acidimicrobiales bacterium]|nr:PAS domain S-box protein [Acidimicrobiales bacterium]
MTSLLPVVTDASDRILERRLELAADLESPGKARGLLRETLRSAERSELGDAAELAISEVVSNAILHAHTAVEVWIGVGANDVCVEVRDFNATLPAQKGYDSQATTGRGMGLVGAVTAACGVHSLADGAGKVVWFRVSDQPAETDADALLAAWDIEGAFDTADPNTAGAEVTLLAMPATLWLSAREHHDAVLREFVLYHALRKTEHPEVAAADEARVLISAAVLEAVERAQVAGTAEPAVPAGHPSPLPWVPKRLDLRVTVPAKAPQMFACLQDVLDAAERLAVDEQLLVRPALPEIIAVRDWVCEQVIAQLVGNSPSPWPGTDQERFERAQHDLAVPPAPEFDAAIVTESGSGAIAVDDANRIVAISDPLAKVLRWDANDLVGRRVVAVIPPALREAHVAGFSRHLSTGEAHVLGVPLDLPVLRKDGTEVVCRFLIERAALSGGRAVYIAWIDPVENQDDGKN